MCPFPCLSEIALPNAEHCTQVITYKPLYEAGTVTSSRTTENYSMGQARSHLLDAVVLSYSVPRKRNAVPLIREWGGGRRDERIEWGLPQLRTLRGGHCQGVHTYTHLGRGRGSPHAGEYYLKCSTFVQAPSGSFQPPPLIHKWSPALPGPLPLANQRKMKFCIQATWHTV